MTVGVSHTASGTVVVFDVEKALRYDLSPETAEAAADECVAGAGPVEILAIDGRRLRYSAAFPDAFATMAADLREHARQARAAKRPEAL